MTIKEMLKRLVKECTLYAVLFIADLAAIIFAMCVTSHMFAMKMWLLFGGMALVILILFVFATVLIKETNDVIKDYDRRFILERK